MTITPAQVYSLIEITEGDTSRVLYDTLTLAGQYIPLSGSTVTLHWYDIDAGTVSIKSASIVNASSGSVSYQLTTGDVTEPGVKLLQWNVRFPSGKDLRIPTGKVIKLNVIGDLED
jgi:hypothetical protein